jgi:hypothetical protein
MILDEKTYLEHYGVMGMHWGIQKARGSTGRSRSRNALLDRNARTRDIISLSRSGERFKTSRALGKAFVGEEQQRSNWKMMEKMTRQQDQRIRSGRLTTQDRLDILFTTSPVDLVVSRTPGAR